MIDSLETFVLSHWISIAYGIALALFLLILYVYRRRFSLWYTHYIVYGLLGKTRRLAKIQEAGQKADWFLSEETVCEDYFNRHYRPLMVNDNDYQQAESYLAIVREGGRSPMPTWVKIVLGLIILLESFGFSYVFSGRAVPGASENLQVYIGFVIAVLISIVMMFLAHITGRTHHMNRLVRGVRTAWINDRSEKRPQNLGQQEQVFLNQNHTDQGGVPYMRTLNRLADAPADVAVRKTWYWALPVIVVTVMVFAYLVRSYVYTTAGFDPDHNTAYFSQPAPSPPTPGGDIAQARSADEMASKLTFAFLSILFALIQLVAVWISSNWGFAGISSWEAYRLKKGFATASEFAQYYSIERHIVATYARRQLMRLQQLMQGEFSAKGISSQVQEKIDNRSSRTFDAYVKSREESQKH